MYIEYTLLSEHYGQSIIYFMILPWELLVKVNMGEVAFSTTTLYAQVCFTSIFSFSLTVASFASSLREESRVSEVNDCK